MKAAVVHSFDQPLSIEDVLDGSAPAPRLVFRLSGATDPTLASAAPATAAV